MSTSDFLDHSEFSVCFTCEEPRCSNKLDGTHTVCHNRIKVCLRSNLGPRSLTAILHKRSIECAKRDSRLLVNRKTFSPPA